MRRFSPLFAALALALSACGVSTHLYSNVVPGAVAHQGLLSAPVVDAVLARLEREKPRRLLLSGPGGPREPMMRMGRYLARHPEIEVVAQGNCFSACAVVWALAADRALAPGAVLGFHGESCPYGCRPGALSDHDRLVLAEIGRSAPPLARALAEADALKLKGPDFFVFQASDLVALGVGRWAEF